MLVECRSSELLFATAVLPESTLMAVVLFRSIRVAPPRIITVVAWL